MHGLDEFFLNFFSMEKLNVRTAAGKAKVMGTIIGIGGSMLLTYFKGQEINVKSFGTNLLQKNEQVVALHTDSGKKFLGVLCGFGSCFSFALWLIIQVPTLPILSLHICEVCGLILDFFCY